MKKTVVFLSLGLLAAVCYAAYLQFEVSRLRERVADLAEGPRQAPLAASSEIAGSTTSDGSPDTELDGAQAGGSIAAAESDRTDRVEEASDRQNWRERRQARMERMASLFEDPELRADMVERQMGRIDSRYAAFFKNLNLSRDELDTLRTLMAERGVVNWETRMRQFGAQSEEERAAVEAERELQRDVLSEEIESLLGREGARALKDYTDSLPYRSEVESLASSLSFTEAPLTESQSEALVASIQNASEGFEYTKDLSNMRELRGEDVTPRDIDRYFAERAERDALVLESASETLNDAQLAMLAERQLAERERDRRQMEFMQQNPLLDRDRGRGPRP